MWTGLECARTLILATRQSWRCIASSSQAASSGPHQAARAPSCRASASSRLRTASGGKSALLRSPRVAKLLRCRFRACRRVFHKSCVGSPRYAVLAAPCHSQHLDTTYMNVLSPSMSPGSLDGRDVAIIFLCQFAVNMRSGQSVVLTGLAFVLLCSTERVCDRALFRLRLSLITDFRSPYCYTRPYLREVDTECVHVEPVQEASKVLAESSQALVHELEVHHVGLKIGDRVRELGEGGLKGVERERVAPAVCASLRGLAKGRPRRGPQWCCRA